MTSETLYSSLYNPDVLSCIANLSNDEVFTPPSVVNAMLDMLPQELFRSPTTTFLDPATKSGVFLREIAKRLIAGLADQIPDLQTRLDHIFHKQVFGIAITELTSLLARRSVYCSKYPNGEYSVSHFENGAGNVRFTRTQHRWQNGKCVFCGASQSEYDRGATLETHAYEWIHTTKPEEIFGMKFDVIIGNPPYQLSDGGNGASAMPVYQLFVDHAKRLNPSFLAMIIPARWYTTGRGLDEFRNTMLNDKHIRVLHDFPKADDCFPGVEIKGGVCYFLWSRDSEGLCDVYTHDGNVVQMSTRPLLEDGMTTFIRSDMQIDILRKVRSKKEKSFAGILNAGRLFGFHTRIDWDNDEHGFIQTADGKNTIPMQKHEDRLHNVCVYIHGGVCYLQRSDVPKSGHLIDRYKVLLPRSGNPGSTIIGKPKLSKPGTCSSNTYVVAVSDDNVLTKETAQNMLSYICTKFFRYLVALKCVTQDIPPKAYAFVPLQNFSTAWSDELLYVKYGLTQEEISVIEDTMLPMLCGGDEDA